MRLCFSTVAYVTMAEVKGSLRTGSNVTNHTSNILPNTCTKQCMVKEGLKQCVYRILWFLRTHHV